MGAFWRPLCWLTNHSWRTVYRDNTVLVRECTFCGKVERIRLRG